MPSAQLTSTQVQSGTAIVEAQSSRPWLPDPVSRFGAVFYAFTGALIWEVVLYVGEHVHMTVTIV
ncbi:hypothetical protein [Streptomyces sp. NPDC002215]|uniref:hypothetical protein n=1 Tax=Streptomyces sp. NPDC002215 TaxID=3154412 RepID=UPI00331C0351